MHCTQQPMSNEDPRVQHFMEKLKRKQAAIRKARNYKNPSLDFSWVKIRTIFLSSRMLLNGSSVLKVDGEYSFVVVLMIVLS